MGRVSTLKEEIFRRVVGPIYVTETEKEKSMLGTHWCHPTDGAQLLSPSTLGLHHFVMIAGRKIWTRKIQLDFLPGLPDDYTAIFTH